MPKNNPYFIKNEIKKPIETVYELKDEYKVPSFEEFMKVYEMDEKVEDSYHYEVDNHGDIRLVKSYGPGGEQSKEAWKTVGKITISTVGAVSIVATGGAAAPIVGTGIALAAGGKVVKEIGKERDNEFLEWIGDTAMGTGIGTIGGSVAGVGSSSLASHIGNSAKAGGSVVSGTMKTAYGTYELYDKAKDMTEYGLRRDHIKHREKGISYDSDCPVCKGEWPFN